MKAKERRKLEKRRRRIAKRLDRSNMPTGDGPVFRGANIVYEVSEKATAAKAGGVAAAHTLAKSVGLARAIDGALRLLKTHQPYHESDLVSNWAYMVIASLAWTLKAWMGLVQPRESDRDDLLKMKFKKFLNCMMLVPCQVVRGARRVMMRVLAYTGGVRLLFETMSAARRLRKVGVT